MRRYTFADEAGNFDFSGGPGASRYLILRTITVDDCSMGTELLALRRDMVWRRQSRDDPLHASTDAKAVRDEVFAGLQKAAFRVDATILEKAKAQPQTRTSDERFYNCSQIPTRPQRARPGPVSANSAATPSSTRCAGRRQT